MGKVQGVKEKLHYPIYDAFFVPAPKDSTDKKTFQNFMTDPRMIRFFVDVQNKTRLETNLQASGVLPSLNTFEARAMRVVVSSPEGHRPIDSQDANEAGFLTDLIYSSVTTLLVGEKIMIEMPTFFFPSGAGVSQGTGSLAVGVVLNHGQADPMSTFRFAEPVIIEPQQNFRVEISFPQGVPGQTQPGTEPDECKLAGLKGPFRIWVVLDGYLTRDVQ